MMKTITGLKYVMFAHAFASLMRPFRVFKASEIFSQTLWRDLEFLSFILFSYTYLNISNNNPIHVNVNSCESIFCEYFFSFCSVLNQFPCPIYILSLSLNTCFHCLLCVHSCFHGTYSSSLIELVFRNSICNAFHVVIKRAHDACIEALMWVIWKADVWNGKLAYYFLNTAQYTMYSAYYVCMCVCVCVCVCVCIYIYIYKYTKEDIFTLNWIKMQNGTFWYKHAT